MKKTYIFLLTIISYSSFSQNITVDELLNLRKDNLATVEEKLTNKGWDYSSGTAPIGDRLGRAVFTYKKPSFNNLTEPLIGYYYNDNYKIVSFMYIKKELYISYLARIKALGFKLIKSDILGENIEKIYKGATVILKISISNDKESKPQTVYRIDFYEYAYYKNNYAPEYDLEGKEIYFPSEKELALLKQIATEQKKRALIEQKARKDRGLIELKAEEYRDSGMVKLKLKNYIGAIADFNKSLQLHKSDVGLGSAYGYAFRGLAKLKLHDVQGANDDFKKAKELHEGIESFSSSNSFFSSNDKRYEDALLYSDLSIALDPNDGDSYNMRGLTKLHLGLKKEACTDFKKAAELGYEEGKKSLLEHCN